MKTYTLNEHSLPIKPFGRPGSYISWMAADTAASIGGTLRGFAIPLIAFSVSQSLVMSGWLSTPSMVLEQVCGLFGGTIVDRHPRKPLIIGNAAAQMLLWSLASSLMLHRSLTIYLLAVLVCLSSFLTGFLGEATNAALRSIVSMRDYPKARSINESRDATINMTGSPIGGILYGIRPWLPFVCSAVVF